MCPILYLDPAALLKNCIVYHQLNSMYIFLKLKELHLVVWLHWKMYCIFTWSYCLLTIDFNPSIQSLSHSRWHLACCFILQRFWDPSIGLGLLLHGHIFPVNFKTVGHTRCPAYNDQMCHAIPCVCFSRRQRDVKPGQSPYRALLETMELSDARLTLQLINENNKVWMLSTISHTNKTVCYSWSDSFALIL